MPWYYFNSDNSLAYRSDNGRLAPSEVEKIGKGVQEKYFENPIPLPQGCEDEEQDLWILEDGTVGIREDMYRHGSKRHIRIAIDYLQMYAPLDELDRPENFEEVVEILQPWVPRHVIDRMLDDDVIDNTEKRQLLEMCDAL